MAPTKRKGEQAVREPAEDETRRRTGRRAAPREREEDRREDEGWTQPESSAQKGPAPRHHEE